MIMSGISFPFFKGTFVWNAYTDAESCLWNNSGCLSLCWKGHCSQMQVSSVELQEDKYIACISPWPILDGKLDQVIW